MRNACWAALIAAIGLTSVVNAAAISKSSVQFSNYRYGVYWPDPNAAEPKYETHSWVPKFEFSVRGPVADGTQLFVKFTKPGGGDWLTVQKNIDALKDADEWFDVTGGGTDIDNKKAIIETGKCGYEIVLKNALAGTNESLMKGWFNVSKFAYKFSKPGNQLWEYVVDHDWTLPVAYLREYRYHGDDTESRVQLLAWFKGKVNDQNLKGYLFKDGKLIASADSNPRMVSTDERRGVTTAAFNEGDPEWHFMTFTFLQLFWTLPDPEHYPEAIMLSKNPGEYEFKALRDGNLCRTMKFKVADGKVVDPGIGSANKLNSAYILSPINIIGDSDGKVDKDAWKDQVFYGNPLTSFAATWLPGA